MKGVIGWDEFAAQEPELAEFGALRFSAAPAYLATIRRSGAPRVHPVTPIICPAGLFLFMEPDSPKGRDLRERERFALHNGVPDHEGSGGEFVVGGKGAAIDDPGIRSSVSASAGYAPAERYVLFELLMNEARCHGYGDVRLPATQRWSIDGGAR